MVKAARHAGVTETELRSRVNDERDRFYRRILDGEGLNDVLATRVFMQVAAEIESHGDPNAHPFRDKEARRIQAAMVANLEHIQKVIAPPLRGRSVELSPIEMDELRNEVNRDLEQRRLRSAMVNGKPSSKNVIMHEMAESGRYGRDQRGLGYWDIHRLHYRRVNNAEEFLQ